ncbi:MAG: hypothetical protein AAFQ98_22805, partial [Bacteroidota bacterium]
PRSSVLRGANLLAMPIGSFFMAFQMWGTVYTLMWLVAQGLDYYLRLSPFWISMLWFLIISYGVFFVVWAVSRVLGK